MIILNRFSDLLPKAKHVLEKAEILSIDIFDTLVFRKVDPDTILYAAARWLEQQGANGVVAACSGMEAYHLAYRQTWQENIAHGYDQEVFSHQLYERWISTVYPQLEPATIRVLAENLIEEYLRLEKLACYRNDIIIPFLDAAKTARKRIIYISDMYLPKNLIDGILSAVGLSDYIAQGYVSSDYGLLKRTGRLFDAVCAEENVDPQNILHVGDNKLADGLMASRSGLMSIYIRDSEAVASRARKKYDWKYLNHDRRWKGYVVANAALDSIDPREMLKEEAYAFRVLGPIFATFMHSVLERCKEEGIRKVYFLAREGLLLKELFKELAPAVYGNMNIPDATYLCISRLTAYHFSAKKLSLYELSCTAANGNESVSNLLSTLRIAREDLAVIAGEHGIPDIDANLPGGYVNFPPFQNLISDPRIEKATLENYKETGKLLEEYLEQVGFFNYDKVAIVDVGWGGQIQNSLYRGLIHRQGKRPQIFGLYLGINGWAHSRATPASRYEGLLADELKPDWAGMSSFFLPHSFEAIVRAPHGTTVNYARSNDGAVFPIFKHDSTPSRKIEMQNEATISLLQKGIETYVSKYKDWIMILGASASEMRPYALEMIDRMIRYPSSDEANILFSIRNVSDLGSEVCVDLRGEHGSKRGFKLPLLKQALKTSFWKHGTLSLIRPRILLWGWILCIDTRHIPRTTYVPSGVWKDFNPINNFIEFGTSSSYCEKKLFNEQLESKLLKHAEDIYKEARKVRIISQPVKIAPFSCMEAIEARLLFHVGRRISKLMKRESITRDGIPLRPLFVRNLKTLFGDYAEQLAAIKAYLSGKIKKTARSNHKLQLEDQK